jgi:hypothetical protein
VESPPPVERLDESLFIEPIEKQREARAAEAARTAEAARAEEARRAAEATRAEEARRAAEAARVAEAARAEEAARIAEAARTEEARRAAEAARVAEAARAEEAARVPEPDPEVLVLVDGEPQGPWVRPIPEAPQTVSPPPEVVVKTPEENGEPRGPWVEPIPEAPRTVSPPPEVLVKLPEENGGQGSRPGPADSPSRETARQAGTESLGPFSVPVNIISELEKGKYYVQLGAYRNAASIESALLRIDSGYPLNVQRAGGPDNPLYRLLVGPLNLGESGALVQRFKGSGYRDAYIRTN